MQNKSLIQDYLKRSSSRLKAIEVLVAEKSWADVVRESQEVVELLLKALLRSANIEIPRVHDVSMILHDNQTLFPEIVRDKLGQLATISKKLRRDRELAFYGSEDLTPSDFYSEQDASEALDGAHWTFKTVSEALKDTY